MRQFEGRVAVVTGAASGIGLEMATQLSRAGAVVVAADVDAERLEAARSGICDSGGQLTARVVDVGDVESIRRLVDETVAAHGHIDYLFNNAGIGGRAGEVRDLEPDDWELILRVNLLSVIHGSSFAYAHMRSRGSGHIVNMASAAGLLGAPQMIPYGTTKAAVVAFSRDLRVEAEHFGVKVTVLCPGYIHSRIFENVSAGHIDIQQVKRQVPFRFVATDRAVTKMLRGVAANRAIVTLPLYVKVIWLLRRLFPTLMDRLMGRKAIADLRKARLSER